MTPGADPAERVAELSDAKRRLLAKLAATGDSRRIADDPLAVVGLSCRFAGADSAQALWQLLARGVDAIGEIPSDRWPADALDGLLDSEAARAVRWGGFIGPIDRFDAAFFGISAREAQQMDPQHRLLVEHAWHALEDAGLSKATLAGSRTGVWAALYYRDYGRMVLAERSMIDAYTGTGTHHGIAANRLSYLWDLRGPSMTIDTACSSSLTALHLASRSLLSHEVDRAIVASVSLMLDPAETLIQARWGMLAPDGRCKTFDARADGFVRGEGCAVLVLERLQDARKAGRPVRALVCGTAVNQDGRSNGLTAPNAQAQVKVIEAALADAGMSPARLSYVEVHGTGTALGDPIEVAALRSVLGRDGDHGGCVIGSIKTNIGHCEAAAGVAGVIKTVLSLEHREIPRSLHFETLNPAIDLEHTTLEVAARHQPWRSDGQPRVAGVSSFGAGGTNAHVILCEAPRSAVGEQRALPSSGAELFTLSGPSATALCAQALAFVRDPPAASLRAICAAASRRTHHRHRLAIVASTRDELSTQLQAWRRDGAHSQPISVEPGARGGVVFVFPGQGSQWVGMGRGLGRTEPVFRSVLDRCDELLRELAGWSLHDVLGAAPGDPRLERIDTIQPTLLSIMIALAAQWRAWGIEPDAVVGQSMGEVAAAHVAGALSLEQALDVVVTRSRLMSERRGEGAMVAVNLPESDAAAAIAGMEDTLSVAVVSSPEWTVLSGERATLTTVQDALDRRGVTCRPIAVDVASHNPAMDALRQPLLAGLASLTPRSCALPFYSSVDGELRDGSTLDAHYWSRNLREPARIWSVITRIANQGYATLLEISPHPILVPPLAAGLETCSTLRPLSLGSLYRGCDERSAMLSSLGRLHEHGVAVDWSSVMPDVSQRVDLPRYVFQRERHWLPRPRGARTSTFDPAAGHRGRGARPLEGQRRTLAHEPGVNLFTLTVDPALAPFVDDHLVEGERILPGVASVEIALAAARALDPKRPRALAGLRFERAILIPEGQTVALQLVVRGDHFELFAMAQSEAAWARAVTGRYVDPPAREPPTAPFNPHAAPERWTSELSAADFYGRLNAGGNTWGPAFQAVRSLRRRPGEVLVELAVPHAIRDTLGRYIFHPALLDACGHAMVETLGTDAAGGATGPFVLAGIARAQLHAPPTARMWAHLTATAQQEPRSLTVDVRTYDDDGRLLAETLGSRILFLHARSEGSEVSAPISRWLYEVAWEEAAVQLDRARTDGRRPGASDTVLELGTESRAPALDECWRVVEALRRASAKGERLWLATRGGVGADGSALCPDQTAAWGLALALAAEQPAAFGGVVDLDPREPKGVASERLSNLFAHGMPEMQVALRGDRVLVPRLRRAHPASSGRGLAGRLRRDSAYLVTGGLGGLGLRLARRLAERGARHIVLLSRRGLPPRAAWADLTDEATAATCRSVRAIETLGASVHVAAVDVGDSSALAQFAERWATEGRPPVRGVFHLAGVQRRASLAQIRAEALAEELHAKVDGTKAIWQIWRPQLELLVLYASAATILPSPLIAGYAAANAFLDGFAEAHQDTQTTVLALDWGVWGEVGLTARFTQASGRSLEHTGMGTMPPERALDGLEAALASGLPRVGVMPIDWPRWAERHQDLLHAPLLDDLAIRRAAPAGDAAPKGSVDRDELADPAKLTGHVRKRIARVLRARPSAIDMSRPLVELGLDSLMALEIKTSFETDLEVLVPVVFLLQGCSGNRLVARVAAGLATSNDEAMEQLII